MTIRLVTLFVFAILSSLLIIVGGLGYVFISLFFVWKIFDDAGTPPTVPAYALPLAKYGFWIGVFALIAAIKLMDVERAKQKRR